MVVKNRDDEIKKTKRSPKIAQAIAERLLKTSSVKKSVEKLHRKSVLEKNDQAKIFRKASNFVREQLKII